MNKIVEKLLSTAKMEKKRVLIVLYTETQYIFLSIIYQIKLSYDLDISLSKFLGVEYIVVSKARFLAFV
jgi:hypothetical protein